MIRDISKRSELAELTAFHHFLNELARNGCLLRHYTQNIDCIEHRLLNLWKKTMQLHGRIDEAMCQFCGWNESLVSDWFCESEPSNCNRCQEIALKRERIEKRRLDIDRLRSNVVLYGEENPKGDMIEELTEQDMWTGLEIVFVIGTALKVPEARRLMTELCRVTKAQDELTVWINRDASSSGLKLSLNLAFHGDCDEVASLL